jgi:vacuolar-type H+-ATPase subunit C/Vma6
MTAKVENISFSLQETCSDKNDEIIVSYEDLVKEVDLMEMNSIIGMDDYIAMEVDYQTNYLKKDLDRIADYYEISKRKKRKEQLVEDIVLFEKDPENIEIVFQRKKLWSYVEEIKSDKYLSKFLILE